MYPPQAALVRRPSPRQDRVPVADALSGAPDLELAHAQHVALVETLLAWELEVTAVEPADRSPYAAFVGDCAAVVGGRAMLARFCDPARRGEELDVEPLLKQHVEVLRPESPAKCLGGDMLATENRLFVGQSTWTNASGLEQAREWFEGSEVVGVTYPSAGPLRSLVAYLGRGIIVAAPEVAPANWLDDFEVLEVPAEERGAIDGLACQRRILLPGTFPLTTARLEERGFDVSHVDLSEFLKLGRGISALALFLPFAGG